MKLYHINFLPIAFKKTFYKICILLFFVSIFELLSVALIIPLFTIILEESNNLKNYFFYEIFKNQIDYILSFEKYKLLIFFGLIYFIFYQLRSLFIFYVKKKEILYSMNVQNFLQETMIDGFIRQRNKIKIDNTLSYYTEIIINQINLYATSLRSLFVLFVEILSLLLFVFFLFFYNFKITFVSIIILAVTFRLYYFFIDKRIKNAGALRDKAQKLVYETVNIISNFLIEIEIFGSKDKLTNNLIKGLNDNKKAVVTNQLLLVTPRLILESVSLLLFLILICFFSYFGDEKVFLSTLAIYVFVILKSFPSVSKIITSLNQIKYLNIVSDQIRHKLHEFKDTNENFNNRFLSKKINFKKKIVIEDISVGYKKNKPLINNINLTIKKNDFIGIQGESGSGKSSLVYTLLGLMKPLNGCVYLDDNLINLSSREWRNNIGYSPQYTKIFKGSLKENIGFGLLNEDINEIQIKKAIELSSLNNFVESLDNGIDSIIYEDATNISGGQRQRIGLARALYHEPEILMLDEFTCSLDKNTEDQILLSLKDLKNYFTIILISHDEKVTGICNNSFKIENKKLQSTS